MSADSDFGSEFCQRQVKRNADHLFCGAVQHLFSDKMLQTSISIWLQLTEIHNPNPSQSWDSASQSPDLHLPILHR